jgi:proline dehydrogenase
MRALTFLAGRFVAGETAADAVAAGKKLRARGIKATFDRLGEDVLDRDTARRAAEASKELLRLIPEDVERNVSIKLSSMGQEISRDFCLENAAGILEEARKVGGFVRLDMEGSKTTDSTLDIFHALRKEFDNVGIVLQAALHRTLDDVKEAIARGDRVRLCKGAYREPAALALQDMAEVRESFKACARLLLEKGRHPAIATHDESLIQEVLCFVREAKIAPSSFEFQMLYGLRRRRWSELVAAGQNVRVYVPYGTHWIPYFTRRLRERKENVLFVLRNFFGG